MPLGARGAPLEQSPTERPTLKWALSGAKVPNCYLIIMLRSITRGGGRLVRTCSSPLVPSSALRLISSAVPQAAGEFRRSHDGWDAAAWAAWAALALALPGGDGAVCDGAEGCPASTDSARWQKVVDATIPAVVSIKVRGGS